jgi:ATP-binding cassette subfamily B protein
MWRRYALVRQHDQSDCGAAALATLAVHYHRPVGLEQMRDLTGTDRAGTNLRGLMHAAAKLGFAAKAVKAPFEALMQLPLPAIAHVNREEGLGHFVVLYRAKKNKVVVADPARGVQSLGRDEFCQYWTGVLLLVVPETDGVAGEVKGTGTAPWRRFFGLLSAHTPLLFEAFCCALLMTLLGAATSYYVQQLVDSVLARGQDRLLNALGVGMVMIVLFRTLFGMLRQYLLAHTGRKVDLALLAGYTRHVLELPLPFFETRRVGEILSRVNDAVKVREAISGTTLTAVVDGTLVLLLLAVLWLYDMPLALVATAFVPVLMISVAAHHPLARRCSKNAMEQGSHLYAHLVEDVSGVDTIKVFGAEETRTHKRERRLVRFIQALFALQKLGVSMSGVGTFVTALAGVVILWYGGHRVMAGALSIGQLLFFYTLVTYLLQPLERLASVNLQLQDALAGVERLYQILDLEVEQLAGPKKIRFDRLDDALELRDVSFAYGCRGPVLENLNLRIPAGQTVAIIGESGSGKSTLLKLLLGLYQPTAGRILIDGADMRDYELASLRNGIGLVSQEPFVFTGSIRENIALGRPDATLEEVVAAATSAGLAEFIADLPQRYDTIVGERGGNLSGGQRQRLAIARALLCRPEILIFDEATSHLDTATERAIQHNLKTVLAGKTVVLVAHRLSTVKDADYIYVLNRGRIAEEGTHAGLLACKGWYGALWASQNGTECREGRGESREAKELRASRLAPRPSPLVPHVEANHA